MFKILMIAAIFSIIEENCGNAKPQSTFPEKNDNLQNEEAGRIFGPISPQVSGPFYPVHGMNMPYGPETYPGAYPSVYGGYPYYRPQVYGQSANYLQSFENYYRKNNKN